VFILFVSCREKNTPEFYAEKYCNCLVKNRVIDNFDSAHLICDGYLEKEIYYLRVFADRDKKEIFKNYH
jgi:hypothetical protein